MKIQTTEEILYLVAFILGIIVSAYTISFLWNKRHNNWVYRLVVYSSIHSLLVYIFAFLYMVSLEYYEMAMEKIPNKGNRKYNDISPFDILYFSVTTETTIGYGEYHAETHRARVLVMLHTIISMLATTFMATDSMIGVNLRLAEKMKLKIKKINSAQSLIMK